MNTEQHILACIDGSAVTQPVCDYAAWYASKLNLPVGLLHVSDVPASSRRDLSGAIGVNSRQLLLEELTQLDEQRAKIANSYSDALVNDAKSHIQSRFDSVDVKIYQRHGKLLPAIEHFNSKNRVIVMGRRGEDHKDSRINIGSQIETVARASSVPVMICSETFKEPTSYMVAFDGSKTAIKAVDIISKSPLLKGLQGHIVMIGNDDETSKKSLAAATEQLKTAGFTIEAHQLSASNAVDGLLAFQQQNAVDIIVIGAYGHSKLQQLFVGSTTTKIIAKTLSPIILVR
ncbi:MULTISPECIES: universal stress protein [unclassified Psychrobacter]|jgi:nucleotide-binding universal stress UspA family protein|uniref:universal stress protein n=1 Tax=unclassified Psychrobacter TaxID=196806 RepID=UPI000C7D0732|nr:MULTISPECIES: universal stress protein [unclassified Psychrobacter]PLT23607.1 universal stress protein [Psychrobacter sp. MES7-P7E]QJS05383.1 universal stress protein, UspA domain protein [Psychrobacter sp.]|tara:strand:+ start:351 stop:1214 length:864 start_codon:yes stop_codon:yes gene_type:complete